MDIYFISGLGIDRSVFQKLKLPPQYTIHYLDWIQPLPKEAIADYAVRLSAAIDKTKPFILIGLSFGGMIATEMTQFLKPVQTIIISSAGNRNELPWYFRLVGFLQLHKLVPLWFLKKPNPLFHWLFTVAKKDERLLFRKIIKEADNKVLSWSINAVVTWKRKVTPSGIIHIHGNKDNLLPIRYTKPDIVINGGGHLMVYSRPEELSQVLTQIIEVKT